MDMLKNMAGEYMNKGGGGGASSEASAGGTDWSSLANLASHMGSADQEASSGGGGDLFSTFTQKLTGGTGDVAEAQAKNADPSVINKLLGLYEQQTGSSFGGSDAEYSILSKLASNNTGIPFSNEILKKLVMWKMQSMF